MEPLVISDAGRLCLEVQSATTPDSSAPLGTAWRVLAEHSTLSPRSWFEELE